MSALRVETQENFGIARSDTSKNNFIRERQWVWIRINTWTSLMCSAVYIISHCRIALIDLWSLTKPPTPPFPIKLLIKLYFHNALRNNAWTYKEKHFQYKVNTWVELWCISCTLKDFITARTSILPLKLTINAVQRKGTKASLPSSMHCRLSWSRSLFLLCAINVSLMLSWWIKQNGSTFPIRNINGTDANTICH